MGTDAAVTRVIGDGLGSAARGGARLGTVSSLGQQVMSVAATAALARLLTPSEFGVAAAANVATLLITMFTQVGLGQRLITARVVSRTLLGTTYWSAVAVGLAAGTGLALLATPLAHLVGVPEAAPLLLLLAPMVVLKVTGAVPRALLVRNLRFRSVYGIDFCWTTIYCATEVILASQGFGARSIPLGLLAGAVASFTLNSISSRLVPPLTFSWAEARAGFRLQAQLQGTSLASTVVKNVDYILVGHLLGPAALGIYYVAYVLPSILRQRLTWVTSEVLMPIYAKMRDDRARLSEAYLRSLRFHSLVGGASMVTVALLADPMVRAFFGGRWDGAVAPMRVLAIAAALDFISTATFSLFLGDGRPSHNLTTQVCRLLCLAALSPLLLISSSLVTVAWLVLGSSAVAALVTQILAARLLQRAVRDLLVVIAPCVTATVVMAATGIALARTGLERLPPIAEMTSLALISGLAFVAAFLVLGGHDGRAALRELARFAVGRVPLAPKRSS